MQMQQLHGSSQNSNFWHAGTVKAKHHAQYVTNVQMKLLDSCPSDYIHDDKLWQGTRCSDAHDLIADACTRHARIRLSLPAFF